MLVTLEKSSLKRDGPVFFSSAPVKVAGDERTFIAIIAPQWERRRVAVPKFLTMEKSPRAKSFSENPASARNSSFPSWGPASRWLKTQK
jgi:hypothetical protein